MKISVSKDELPVFEALSSSVRIDIIHLLSKSKMNVKEIAENLGLSNPVVARHINKLEHAKIIKTEKIPGKSGIQKVCSLRIDHIDIEFPKKIYHAYDYYDLSIPIGQYTDCQIIAPCGLASVEKIIGDYDEPKFFLSPERATAEIFWFSSGYVEYKVFNPLSSKEKIEMIDFTIELGSEFPGGNNIWPSNLHFTLNNQPIGNWTSPGDFIDVPGKNNPDWWPAFVNQYGTKLVIRITDHGVWFNGKQSHWSSFKDLHLTDSIWTFRIQTDTDPEKNGGCTVFGKNFGNYESNVDIRFYYSEQNN